MINVTNNYLENNIFYTAKNLIFSSKFPWTFASNENDKFLQFYHSLVISNKNNEREVSPFMSPTISYLLKTLNVENVLRAEVVMITKTTENIDIPIPTDPTIKNRYKSILCLNTSNSNICIGGGDVIECIENRIITIPSNLSHNITSPSDKNFTCLIVIEYKKSL
tara:strand:+ start:2584 stop:3078 length:495 start_codon:yes stop_codon:yes gene_type:complete